MYIFKFPAAADFAFTYANLNRYVERGVNKDTRKVGTTVQIERTFGPGFRVRLYDTVIATVYSSGTVEIPEEINNHGSQATGNWVAKVLYDNGYHRGVWRTDGKYEGVAGQTFIPAGV